MVQPTFIQDMFQRTSSLEEAREGSLRLARILGPVPAVYTDQDPYATVYNLQLVDARLAEPMADRVIQAVLAAQTMWQMRPDFLYTERTNPLTYGNRHTHEIIHKADHPSIPAYVQSGFAEPNGGYFALVEPVRAGRASFWVIAGFILQTAIKANPTTPD